jgi:hypothetical protein
LTQEYRAARHVGGLCCCTLRKHVEQWQTHTDRAHAAQERATTVPL